MILPAGVVSKKDIGAVSVESKRAEKSYKEAKKASTNERMKEKRR